MKSLKYIIVLGIVTGVTFSSCEDWLDENPKYSVDNTVNAVCGHSIAKTP